jgi:hypothetical protein
LGASLALAVPMAKAQRHEPFRVIAQEKDLDRQSTQLFFRRVDAALDRVCRDVPGQTPECTIALTRLKLRGGMEMLGFSDGRLQVYLPEAAEGWQNDRRRVSNLLGALLLHRLGQPVVTTYKRMPNWLTAGLLNMLQARLNDVRLPGIIQYPGLQGMVEAGTEYPLESLLASPLEPEDGVAYALQMEAGEALLLGILRLPAGRDLLNALIVAGTADGKLPDQAFADILDPVIFRTVETPEGMSPDDARQGRRQLWYAGLVRQMALNPFYPASATLTEVRFRDIMAVSYRRLSAGAKDAAGEVDKGQLQACLFEEMGERWAEMDQPEKVLARQKRAIAQLHFMASELVRPALEDLLSACRSLEAGDHRGFGRQVQDARRDFYERLARLGGIERRLRDVEASLLPPGQRYAAELKVVREADVRRRHLWPALYDRLDREEALLNGTQPMEAP